MSLALRSDGHSTFFDQNPLAAGRTFDNRIRSAIEECDIMLFLVTPHSIEPGSYARAELNIAQSKWIHRDGRLLPVVIVPTSVEDLPPYLRTVSLSIPQGDVVAEVVAAVSPLSKPEW